MLGTSSTGSTQEAPHAGTRQPPAPQVRQSPALEQFFAALRGERGLALLDLSGASQANISFITNLGHRLYSDDFMNSLDEALARGGPACPSDAVAASRFFDQNLPAGPATYDGALLWDCLQFLPPLWLEAAIERLLTVLRPDATLLAYFNSDEKAATVPLYQYRIADERRLNLIWRGSRAPAQYFNNRSLERLFQRFSTTRFFLTRDHLRELLVKR